MEEETIEEFIPKKNRRYVVLVIYDIVDNKQRGRMVKCLEKYGLRVQKSAFEAYLTRVKYEELVKEASRIIDENTDSLRIYFLSANTLVRTWGIGDVHTDDVIIV